MMGTLIDHMEDYLGRITNGATFDKDTPNRFAIARFDGGLAVDYSAMATLGISSHLLEVRDSGSKIRQEFMMLFRPDRDPSLYGQLLLSIAEGCFRTHKARCHGDLTQIGPPGPIVPGSTCHALYAGSPSYYPPEFATCESPGPEPTTIVWMFPVTDREAAFVHEHGWERFEEELQRHNPDLVDFFRPSIV